MCSSWQHADHVRRLLPRGGLMQRGATRSPRGTAVKPRTDAARLSSSRSLPALATMRLAAAVGDPRLEPERRLTRLDRQRVLRRRTTRSAPRSTDRTPTRSCESAARPRRPAARPPRTCRSSARSRSAPCRRRDLARSAVAGGSFTMIMTTLPCTSTPCVVVPLLLWRVDAVADEHDDRHPRSRRDPRRRSRRPCRRSASALPARPRRR